jgi:hypothetical protein
MLPTTCLSRKIYIAGNYSIKSILFIDFIANLRGSIHCAIPRCS